jgi:menaquinone-dependent protoporphyrinogen oxidase
MTIKASQLERPLAASRKTSVAVLIPFATTEGQTHKIAERIALHVRERGHEANVYDTASLISDPGIDLFDAVIVAASVHEEHHQESAIDFATAHRDQLARRSSAFVSVSLSAATACGRVEAQQYVDRFIAATGWAPTKTLLLGGALRWSECDYFQRQVLKHVLLKGAITPDENVNYEFTDWTALESFIDDFLADCLRVDDPSLRPAPLLH